MPNLKIKDKIIKLGDRYGLSPTAMLLLKCLIDKCDNSLQSRGDIVNYKTLEPQFINLFKGGLTEYYIAFSELVNNGFIEHSSEDNYVLVRPFIGTHYYSIMGTIQGRKRQYIKNHDTVKKEYRDFLNKYGTRIEYFETLPGDQLIRYTTKTSGVKIPDSLRPYFTSEPITGKDGKIIALYDNDYLRREMDRRNLTKEEKRVYYACIKFADTNGVIDDYNILSLVNSIIIEFGDGAVCQSTVYLVINKLLQLGLIFIDYSPIDASGTSSCSCRLIVAGYKEAFERKERYVIIPDVVLEKAFKKCSAAAIKVFFHVLFRLNNGDDGSGKSFDHKKTVHFSFAKYLPNGSHQKQYEVQEDWLKKRYPGEMCTLVWGDIDDSEVNSLAYFFNIRPVSEGDNLSYYFSIKKEFYISKTADLLKRSFELTGKNKRRAQAIEEACKKHDLYCSQEDILDLVKVFRGAGRKNINLVIGQLADRIRLGEEKGWPKINSIPAFACTLYNNSKNRGEDASVDPPEDPFT